MRGKPDNLIHRNIESAAALRKVAASVTRRHSIPSVMMDLAELWIHAVNILLIQVLALAI
jgi:hypothetical protein